MEEIFHTELRVVRGITFQIHSIYSLDYSGEWIHSGFDVCVAGKKLVRFCGFPTNEDVWRSLQNY